MFLCTEREKQARERESAGGLEQNKSDIRQVLNLILPKATVRSQITAE